MGRLGWQLSPDCMANLKGIFHVQQLPGTAQVRWEMHWRCILWRPDLEGRQKIRASRSFLLHCLRAAPCPCCSYNADFTAATFVECVLQVVLCGFGSECNIASIEALSDVEPLDTTNTLQLLQSLQQTAQAAQAQQAQQHIMPPPQQPQQAQPQQAQAQQAQQVQQGPQQGQQAQRGEEQGGHPPSNGPSSSASCAASRPRSGSPSPRAQDIAPRVAAGGVDGQLTYQMMSERMSDLYNWVVSNTAAVV